MKIELEHLKYDHCPECQARWVMVGVDTAAGGRVLRHSMGGEWQYVKYACGRMDKYSPNLGQVQTLFPCSNSAKIQDDYRRKDIAKKFLLKTLSTLDLKDSEREAIERQLRCTLDSER